MGKLDFKRLKVRLKKGWNKNGQMVLAVMAGACAIGAVVEAVRVTPKASIILETRKNEIDILAVDLKEGNISTEEYQKKARKENLICAKNMAVCYASTAAFLMLSVGSTACNYKISIGKQAALLGAYKALESKSNYISEKAKEILGEKQFKKLETAITKDQLEHKEMPEFVKDPVYEKDENGEDIRKPYMYPCWLSDTQMPFMSTVTNIDMAMAKASKRCYSRNSITLNEIYELLDPSGLQLRPSEYGDTHGFIASDLNGELMLPYSIEAIHREGYDHAFSALKFDKPPALLGWD